MSFDCTFLEPFFDIDVFWAWGCVV